MFEEFDEYTKRHPNEAQSMTAPEIAYLIFNLPIHRVLERILNDDINGQSFIDKYQNNEKWIKRDTGWSNDDIVQIEAILFRHSSMTKDEIITILDNAMNKKRTFNF